MGSINDFVFSIGIAKRLDTDIIFHELKRESLLVDRIFSTSPYRLRMSALPKFLCSLLSVNDFQTDIKLSMEAIIQEENNKRHELFYLLKQNPFLPRYMLVSNTMYSWYFGWIGSFLRVPIFSCLLAAFVFILTGYIFVLIYLLCLTTACMIDFFTCRLFATRGTESEQDWIDNILYQYPQFNTLEIDREIINKMESLAEHLTIKYPALQVDFRKSIEKYDENHHSCIYFEDVFLLKIRSKVNSNHKSPLSSNSGSSSRTSSQMSDDETTLNSVV
jgi:hypothetical protein